MQLCSNGKSQMCTEKCREYLPVLTGKGFSLKLKVRCMQVVWEAVWSVVAPMKVEHEAELDKNEKNILRWMCGKGRKTIKIWRLGNYWDCNQSACQLRGVDYGGLDHVEHNDDVDWLKSCMKMEARELNLDEGTSEKDLVRLYQRGYRYREVWPVLCGCSR